MPTETNDLRADHEVTSSSIGPNRASLFCRCGTEHVATRAFAGENLLRKAHLNHRAHVSRIVRKATR